MRQLLSGELIDTGIDYITCTFADRLSIERAQRIAYKIACQEDERGMIGKAWSAGGYDGFKCGSIIYGERDDGAIVRASSHVSSVNWWKFFELATNVTRFDVQCTFRVTEKPERVVHRHYQEFQRHARKMKRAPEVWRMTNSHGGYTAYTGVRASDVFGRIYNKEAQKKLDHWQSCVRYEVQFNKKRALRVSRGFHQNYLTASQVASEVLCFFAKRGARCRPLQESIKCFATIVATDLPRQSTDVARKLEWLRTSVGPTIKLLIERGEQSSVEVALNLQRLFQVVDPSGAHGPTTKTKENTL